jgi:iron complex outermembrane recepter protein
MKRVNAVCSAVALVLMASSALAQGMPERKVAYDVAAQPLPEALNAFAKQSKVRIVFEQQDAQGLRSESLKGSFTPQAALKMLLGSSSLRYEFVDDHTVEIRGTSAADTVSSSDGKNPSDLNKTSWVAMGGPIRLAQSDTPPPANNSSSSTSSDVPEDAKGVPLAKIEQVVVTGTLIHGVSPDSSPSTLYTREDIERTGATTVAQFAKMIPQNFASVDGTSSYGMGSGAGLNILDPSNNFTKGSSINLRGLGVGATLVLFDGRRMAPAGSSGYGVDVSLLPLSAIDHVEVLTDGASAIYGADAVAGVVNFVPRRDYSGAEVALRYGNSNDGGGAENGASLTLGSAWRRGNVLFSYEHYEQDSLKESDRDFVTFNAAGQGLNRLVPRQHRNSFLANGSSHLTETVEALADAYYTDRQFGDVSSSSFARSDVTGGAKTAGGSVGLRWKAFDSWIVQGVGGYADTKANVTTISTLVAAPSAPTTTNGSTESEIKSIDVTADGPIFDLPAGSAKLSLSGQVRREFFANTSSLAAGTQLERDVTGTALEIFVPVVSSRNARGALKRFELSAAVRRDHYDDFGSATKPKFGVLWSPLNGLNVRASYAEAFRAPPIAKLTDGQPSYILFPIPNGSVSTNTLFDFSGGNPTLQPETSTSKTFGIDYRKAGDHDVSLSATYFKVDYRDRIASPPLGGNPFTIYSNQGILAPFIDFNPDPSFITEAFQSGAFVNPLGLTQSQVQAVFDNRLQNISESSTDGVDMSVSWKTTTSLGTISPTVSGSYLLSSKFKSASTTPSLSQVGIVFFPPHLRARGGVNWSLGDLSSSITANYVGGGRNTTVVPSTRVGSWTTIDWHFAYSRDVEDGTFLDGMGASVNVQNVANNDPPTFAAPVGAGYIGFDPSNTNPLGRFYSVMLNKRW